MADRFAGVWVADGSKLDAVARRLKVLWDDRRVPLPGSLLAFYDLRHGVLARLAYRPPAPVARRIDDENRTRPLRSDPGGQARAV